MFNELQERACLNVYITVGVFSVERSTCLIVVFFFIITIVAIVVACR